jgi:hypothetical protein
MWMGHHFTMVMMLPSMAFMPWSVAFWSANTT